MAIEQFRLIVIQVFVSQAVASYVPYFQYAGTPYSFPAYVTSYPAQSYAPNPAPVYTQSYTQSAANYQPGSNLQPYKTPTIPVGSYAQTASGYTPANAPVSANTPNTAVYQPTAYQASPHQQPVKATSVISPPPPVPPKLDPIKSTPLIPSENLPHTPSSLSKELLSGVSPPFDSNVLNNLAIALQLLIVSNLIHNPPPEPHSVSRILDEELFPSIAPLPIALMPPSSPDPPSYSNHIPNANFLGTSSFGDSGISKSMMSAYGAPTIAAPRPTSLMSPYDAIGPNSPYVDSFKSKSEPKSPYHLSSDYKDLFSLTELFKI